MLKETTVNLCNFLLSLSDAVELACSSIAAHQIRTAFIAWQMAKQACLSQDAVERIFIAALFHDIGAMSPEDKIDLHKFELNNVSDHCIRGEAIFRLSPLFAPSAEIVRYHHTPWIRWTESIDKPYVLESQILNLADNVERKIRRDVYILHQEEKLTDTITKLSGRMFHPDVVALFRSLAVREDFWLDIVSPRLCSIMPDSGPLKQGRLKIDEVQSLALIFRSVIDFRSSFTATHSTGVAECAKTLALMFGFNESEAAKMEFAGNFHDIGKMAIPNAILNKPGKLTREEFAIVRQHTYFTYNILNTIGDLGEIPAWAAFHHEKLDGSGYPFHLTSDAIDTGGKIMAVADIFTALSEDRPYRKGMARGPIENILSTHAGENLLDSEITTLLLDNYDDIFLKINEARDVSKTMFENEFATLP